MILKLIEEINKCLDNNCYLVALSSALTLPDICGKAEYPNMKPSERYIKWYDEEIGQYENTPTGLQRGIPHESGLIVYSLRNSLLHDGNPNINEKTCDIQEFELLVEGKDTASSYVGSAGIERRYVDEEEVCVIRSLCINIRQLCFKLCIVAEHYYKNNKEKFGFINSKLTYVNPRARKLFDIKGEIVVEE